MSQVEEIFVMDIEEVEEEVQAPAEVPFEQNFLDEGDLQQLQQLLEELDEDLQLLTPEENDIYGNNYINEQLLQLREDPHMFDLNRMVRQYVA